MPGDRGDKWTVSIDKNGFLAGTTRTSANVVIQIVCPNGGISVTDGTVEPSRLDETKLDVDGAGNRQECNNAATYTYTASQYITSWTLTIYVPDGVEGYFPYTIVASASS